MAASYSSYAVRPQQGMQTIDSSMAACHYNAVFPFYSHSKEKFFLASVEEGEPTFTALAGGEAQVRGMESIMLSNLWKEDVEAGAWEMFPYPELVQFPQILKSCANTSEAIFQAMKQTKPWAVDFLVGNYMKDSKEVAAFGQRRGLKMQHDSEYVQILKKLGATDDDFRKNDEGTVWTPITGMPRDQWDVIAPKVMKGILYCKFNLPEVAGCGQKEAATKMRRLLSKLSPSTLFLESTDLCAVWGDKQGKGGKNLLGKLLTGVASCVAGNLSKENFLQGNVSEDLVTAQVDYVRFNCNSPIVAFSSCFPSDFEGLMTEESFLQLLSKKQNALTSLEESSCFVRNEVSQ